MPDDETATVRRVLAECQTWAVVGLSEDPFRPAHDVARFLQSRGKRIVPVHPDAATALGEQAYPTLADVPFPVDCVDVFRRSDEAGRHADEAVDVGAKAVWFQFGVVDEAAYERTRSAGLDMLMDRCPKVDWARYGPR
jgi:uncharacterized protein